MNKASLVLNVVLVLAVAVLFYLHFAQTKNNDGIKPGAGATKAVKGECRIAYFEMDSINNSFAMVKDVRSELSREEEKINNELAGMQKRYNDKFTQFQSQAKAGMSAEESDKINREVVRMQQDFAASKQEMSQRMQNMTMTRMQEVKTKVENYLKEYNKSKGYAYILAYESGTSFVFYRDSAYDITADLIKGLNAEYKTKK